MLPLPFAVHISDGVLSLPVVVLGFAGAALLAAFAAWRVREEEIPRIALLTAAFFVASSIHVKLGPATSVHLLLNGLVGVLLGRRAPLAILVGVALQALLIPHGGLSTIGVNACVEILPALLAGALFAGLSWGSDGRPWVRSLLVGSAALIWGWCLLFGVGMLATAPLGEVVIWSSRAGVQLQVENLEAAWALSIHPLALLALAGFVGLCVVAERRMNGAPGFPRGALVGMLAVLATTLLTCLVLLLGTDEAAEPWRRIVSLVFVAHLPLALIEGLIVGCAVAFLGRVKPEMLGARPVPHPATAAFIASLALLGFASPALAHALEAEFTVDREKHEVTVKGLYETGDLPKKGAKVVVKRGDGSVLAEGALDEKGVFVFRYEKAEPLTVRVEEAGHIANLGIKAADLEGAGGQSVDGGRGAGREGSVTNQGARWRDLALGLGLLLALAAFVMSWRNGVRIARLERIMGADPAPVAPAERSRNGA